jgi:hypothetical protein
MENVDARHTEDCFDAFVLEIANKDLASCQLDHVDFT